MRHTGYVLRRHARHDRGRLLRDEATNGRPSRYPTEAVADTPRDFMLDDHMELTRVFCATTPEALSTARVIQDVLAGGSPSWAKESNAVPTWVNQISQVVPPPWVQRVATSDYPRVLWSKEDLLDPLRNLHHGDAPSAWSASSGSPSTHRLMFLRYFLLWQLSVTPRNSSSSVPTSIVRPWWWHPRAWLRGGVPIQSGEVVCLAVNTEVKWRKPRWSGQLLWQISPDDSKAEEQIRDKIKSKMEAAKQLSAVITLLLTALLGALTRKEGWPDLGTINVSVLGAFNMSAVLPHRPPSSC